MQPPYGAVKAVFPDAGCAAMLKARWPDAPFGIASSDGRGLSLAYTSPRVYASSQLFNVNTV